MSDGASLIWRIKASFIDYVEGMADGHVDIFDGAEALPDGRFRFPQVENTDGGALIFTGTTAFSGHFGMLALTVSRPTVVPRGDGFALTIFDDDAPSQSIDFVSLGNPTTRDGSIHFDDVTLTRDGAELFFDTYRPGTLFEAIELRGIESVKWPSQ